MGSVSQFINGFNGGTRLNRFEVTGSIGGKGNFNPFHVRSATLPEAIMGEAVINYRGRSVSYPGDRTYKPWNIVILDDNTNSLHKAFHDWSNKINNHQANTSGNAANPKADLVSGWQVKQYDSNGGVELKTFTLNNCWPMVVGPLQLDMGQDNTFATFAVSIIFTDYSFTIKT